MINVSQLLALPGMNQLKLANDPSGLQNKVSGTGIFEWEDIETIKKTFNKGEFVVTSLSNVKDNSELLFSSLNALIKLKVSAIAIKTVWCFSLPSEIVELANIHKIPIFFFDGIYMDDIIYEVKNALLNQNLNSLSVETLKSIMASDDSKEISSLSYKLNPLFFDNYYCICIAPKKEESNKNVLTSKLSVYNTKDKSYIFPVNSAHSFIKCNRCFLLIFSFEGKTCTKESLSSLLGELSISTSDFYISISSKKNNLSQMSRAIYEALLSQAVGQIDSLSFFAFDSLGVEKLIFSDPNQSNARDYYNHFNNLLEAYDREHNSNLKETLVTYTKCGNDINLASEVLFQHSNTVRYRLSKAKSVLSLEDVPDSDIQLYIYARMAQIFSILDKPWL